MQSLVSASLTSTGAQVDLSLSLVFLLLGFSLHVRFLFHLVLMAFSSVQSLSCVRLFVTSWTTVHQASLPITNSWSSPRLMFIESVMPSSHLILCHPLLLLPPEWHKQRHYFANKVRLVKATVFPVVMYGCESWTIKKAERRIIDAFQLCC